MTLLTQTRQCVVALLAVALYLPSHRPLLAQGDAGARSAGPPAVLVKTPRSVDTQALPDEPPAPTVFPHSPTSRYLIAGQSNVIFQGDPGFHSPYEGINSFIGRAEYKTSLLGTLYLGFQLRKTPTSATEFLLDFESSGGRGLGEALGLAGFTNLDVVRNPNLGSTPYIARIQLHETIGLSHELVAATRNPFDLATQVPVRRLEFRFGKMSLPDLIDINAIGSDSHLQFLNWTVDNNGAWDYAADTRGYTYAATAEYDDYDFSARYALALMPTVANGINLDWNLHRASGQNVEVEMRKPLLGPILNPDRHGAVRVLGYVNHAHMGLYRDAINAYLSGQDSTPTITLHERFGAVKYGLGINGEQELTANARAFFRLGWNEGQHESFAYTEVDQTMEFGGDYSLRDGLAGLPARPLDKVGIAFVTNAIKRDHQNYLKLGGLGFLLGDGTLSYAREDIVEGYYNLHVWRGMYYAFDTQFIDHPGYNQARGPVVVFSVRSHIDF